MQSLLQETLGLTLRALATATICIVLMTADHRNNALQQARSSIGTYLVYPIQYLVAIPGNVIQWSVENLSSRNTLLEKNSELNRQNLELLVRQQQLQSLQQENARLRELMRSSARIDEDILIAEVLTVDQDYNRQQILINKGKSSNLYPGQPIIDAKGVMGQIVELTQYSARVLLISDPSHALPVQNNRNGVRTIAQGKGDPAEVDLLHIPNNTDIKIGDLLITSGLGGRFPSNYPVATVTEVEIRPGEEFARVAAKPTAELDTSREVLLVWVKRESDE